MGLPDGEDIIFVLTKYRPVMDSQTDRQARCDPYYPRYHSVARVTRSQAVARIADRIAKNCRGHVT